MDNSKIFSKIHGAYKDNFRKLQVFGIFGMENHTSSDKLVRVLITLVIVVYPMVSLTFGFTSIQNFAQFVEHTANFLCIADAFLRFINIAFWKNKILEIAELFQELKKFDENDIVKKAETSLKRLMKFCFFATVLIGDFHCINLTFFENKHVFLGLIQFLNEDITLMIGTFDVFIIIFLTDLWINCQTILYLAYTQLTAHLRCLIVKFSKINKPQNAEDSKKNLEKLHEIIEIHQKVKG
jgi:hypothetical protein